MKSLILTALILNCSTIVADSRSLSNQKFSNLESPEKSRKLKSLISQKSIENVIETVELIKEKIETAYKEKRSKIDNIKSI